jgi:hypothetical protein
MTINQDGHKDDDQAEGAGPDGTMPDTGDGIALTTTDEPSNFEPEEDAPAEA